jgi:hypothetical protein
MTQPSFDQLPQVSATPPQPMSAGRAMAWLTLLFAVTWPRAIILGFWVFSDLLGDAYDGWVLPVAGFLVLPWTTMTYAVMWSVSSNVVSGTEWAPIVLALGADLITWVGARAIR